MSWQQLLELLRQVTAEQGEDRRVLLVLPDVAYHVKEVVAGAPPAGEDGLLGLVVYKDDPELSQRTDESCLLFVRPQQVQRIVVTGYEAPGRSMGFVLQ